MNHSPFLARALPVFILAASTGFAQPGPTPSPAPLPPVALPGSTISPSGAEDLVGPLNMPGDSVDSALGLIERWTGKTLLRPQNLPQATLSINIRERITKREAIQAVETVLNLNGIALTPLGDRFLKVTALNAVKSEAPELIEGSTLDLIPSGRTASKLFTLQFLRVTEFMPQIAGLLNPAAGSPPVIFDKGNSALITDSVSNLQRVETLITRLDQPSLAGLKPKFYQIRNGAKASDLVNKLRAIFAGTLQTQLGTSTSFSADDRTNQIALIADPRQYPVFDELIEKLDVKSDPNTRNEIIKLKAAAAKDVATILSQLVTGQNNAAKTAGQENVARTPSTPGGPAAPAANAQPAAAAPAPAASAVIANLAGQGLELGANQFSPLLTILPDERSNALVVSGTLDDIRLIRELVDKIDILLAQVRIEVIIAEVTLSDTDTSGINALNLTFESDASHGTHITKFDTGTSANGIAGWNITGGVVNPLAFQAALGNTGSKHNVKILSAPTVVTTHNKEAKFAVTQQQPIITNTQTTPINTGTPYTNDQVSYKDIGITLTVKPLIGDDGSIQLTIDQIVDDVIANVTVNGNVQPVIGHREANSFVNVIDGQMIVLGGLQRNTHTRDRTKLGFLWEIPIISHLFGGRTNDVERTELLLFVRPHVLHPETGTVDTTNKINELSNKDQVHQYLADPTKPYKEGVMEKIK